MAHSLLLSRPYPLVSRSQAKVIGAAPLAAPVKVEGVLDLTGVTLADLIEAGISILNRRERLPDLRTVVAPPRVTIREKIGKGIGDTVAVVLERDTDERVVELPPELKAALRTSPEAARRYETLSHTRRKELAGCVAAAKQPETRLRRAEKAVREILDPPARAPKK